VFERENMISALAANERMTRKPCSYRTTCKGNYSGEQAAVYRIGD